MTAREIMVQPVLTVRSDACLADVAALMLDHRFGCVPVVDDAGRLCGVVTESDFSAKERGVPFSTLRLPQVFHQWLPPRGIERIYEAARTTLAGEVMSTDLVVATEQTPVDEVVRHMLYRDINHIPVLRDSVPVGIISRHDLLRMMVPDVKVDDRVGRPDV